MQGQAASDRPSLDSYDQAVADLKSRDGIDSQIVRTVRSSEAAGHGITVQELFAVLTERGVTELQSRIADRVDALVRLGVLERDGLLVGLCHGPPILGEVS